MKTAAWATAGLALALALLPGVAGAGAGWYLLIPPVYGEGEKLEVARSAPLREWGQALASDSAGECEAARAKVLDAAQKALKPGGETEKLRETLKSDYDKGIFRLLIYKRVAEIDGRCIASDDPRLK